MMPPLVYNVLGNWIKLKNCKVTLPKFVLDLSFVIIRIVYMFLTI